jgi:tRNA-dihydrouridine synthase
VSGVMVGRSAISNPAVFDLLKGNNIPTKRELTNEYKTISEKFKENKKYFENYLNWNN